MKYTPHKYQEKAIKFGIERACAGLFLEPGLGKTSITYAIFKILKNQKMVRGMLVIAPLRPCYSVWPKERDKWEEFHKLRVEVLHGPKKDEALAREADVYVINPEGLAWLSGKLGRMRDWPFDMLVVDESTKFKHTNTSRFKLLKGLLNKFRRRYILTGTPAPNGLMDLFGQVYIMDMGATFGPYITHFRNEFFYPTGFGGYDWKLKPKADKAIHARLAPRVLQMSAKDYLDLPELIINDVFVDLPPTARQAYDQMELALRLDFAAGKVQAANSGVASMKCRQIASGGVYDDNGNVVHIHDAKAEAVGELFEELSGQPVLIGYEFVHELDRIRKYCGDLPHIGNKGVKPKDMPALIKAWHDGRLSGVIGQPQSMAHGTDGLQGNGRAVIYHTIPWNFEDYWQFILRIWRQGQKERVIVHRVIARDTVDEAVAAALKSKKQGQDSLFSALKDYWEKRPVSRTRKVKI